MTAGALRRELDTRLCQLAGYRAARSDLQAACAPDWVIRALSAQVVQQVAHIDGLRALYDAARKPPAESKAR